MFFFCAYYSPNCAKTSYIKLDGLNTKEKQELEQYRKVMCKPLSELKEELEILEILKHYINISSDGIISCHDLVLSPFCDYHEKQYELIKNWLKK